MLIHAAVTRRLLILLGLSLLGAFGSPARAWNPAGHMTVAGIAYNHLRPRTRAAVDALLAQHRDYGKWMALRPAGYQARGRFAFMQAATWPDDVRHTPDDRPTWHYTDVPVIAPGFTPAPAALQPSAITAETQLPAEAKLLADPAATVSERAVALCWVEHLVGDIHQPLHDASLFSAHFPKGDKGGNSELLTRDAVAGDPREAAAHPHNLHALWDDLLGETRNPREIDKIAAALEKPAYARKTYPQIARHTTVHAWVQEGNALARDVAYASGRLPSVPNGEKADVTLPPGYLAAAHRVANRLVALAGLRLADLLNGVTFPPVNSAPTVTPPPSPPISAPGPILGNRRTRVYHRPGDNKTLPSERNRVYFQTEEDAVKAGYHPAWPGPK